MKFATLTFTAALMLHLLGCAQQYKYPRDRAQAQVETTKIGSSMTAVPTQSKATPYDNIHRRLESFTWDSIKHKLTWKVSRGEKAGDSFRPLTTDQYNIDMDNATMTFAGQTRRFSEEEAANVQVLMGLISEYTVESTVWWENGAGEPLDGIPQPQGKPKSLIPSKTRIPSDKAVAGRSLDGFPSVLMDEVPVSSASTPTRGGLEDSLLALSALALQRR